MFDTSATGPLNSSRYCSTSLHPRHRQRLVEHQAAHVAGRPDDLAQRVVAQPFEQHARARRRAGCPPAPARRARTGPPCSRFAAPRAAAADRAAHPRAGGDAAVGGVELLCLCVQTHAPINRRIRLRRDCRRTLVNRRQRWIGPTRLPELDHAVGRQAEELHRRRRVAHHPREQLLAPHRHARMLARRSASGAKGRSWSASS